MSDSNEISQHHLDQAARLEMPSFQGTQIPDHSTVVSQISLLPQTIGVEFSELQSYFDWINEQRARQPNELGVIERGALLTMNNLTAGDQRWEEIVAAEEDGNYTLGRSIGEGVNTCFQRSVFFNVVMQQAGIQASTEQGTWVDSDREDLTKVAPSDTVLQLMAGGNFITEADRQEGHLWNLASADNAVYLVDSSYLVRKGERQVPVIHRIDGYKPGQKKFDVPLPTGKTRHYIINGSINVVASQTSGK